MAHVKLSGDVWRWHNDSKCLLGLIDLRMKVTGLLPFFINSILHVLRIISFLKLFSHLVLHFHKYSYNV